MAQDLVLVGVNQVANLIQNFPALKELDKIALFFEQNQPALTPQKTCNCKVKVVNQLPRQTVSELLSSLSDSEYEQIKSVTG